MIYIISLYWYTLIGCHIPHTLVTSSSLSFNDWSTSAHFFVLCCLRYPSTFLDLFLHLFNPYEILQITDAITLKVWFFYAPTQFNSLSSAMMSIWTRWLKPCLIGLSTSLHKIITVSQYSPPLIIIQYFVWMLVNRCNLCLSMLILSLYRPSVRKDWFVAYLQLLSFDRKDTFGAVICWTSTTFS